MGSEKTQDVYLSCQRFSNVQLLFSNGIDNAQALFMSINCVKNY